MLISSEYAALNAALHESDPTYGISGHKWAEHVHELAIKSEATTLLDYGCGRGTLRDFLLQKHKAAFEVVPYEIIEYDPAIPGKTEKPLRADVVVCGDVLEHVEPVCLYPVLDDLKSIARKAVFLLVATRPARKHLADGRNAHLIIEPSDWWVPKLILRWSMMAYQDIGGAFIFIGRAR